MKILRNPLNLDLVYHVAYLGWMDSNEASHPAVTSLSIVLPQGS